jgi:hypothetical protein
VDTPTPRYPVTNWVIGALVTTAVAVAIRFGAALAGVEVVIPDRAGGDPVPLELGPIVVITLGAFLAAIVAVLVLDRLLHGRSRRILRVLALLVLAGSLVPVHLGDLPTDATVVLTVLHLVVGIAVLRIVVRE